MQGSHDVNTPVVSMLEFVQGPVFRFALALMILGLLRQWFLIISDTIGGYVTSGDRRFFWRKLGQRLAWYFLPSVLLHRLRPAGRFLAAYHTVLFLMSLTLRVVAVIVALFMVAHVHLWERGLGVSWPAIPEETADLLSIVTIIIGVVMFFGRLYSPVLRSIEPPWSFLKPLVFVVPFITGLLARHPALDPVDYHPMMLMHVLSACVVFVMIPFGRMMFPMHLPLAAVMPEAAWRPTPAAAGLPAGGEAVST
jgi:hypothetical protein